ncbi:LON peptidase substrate-binding domain-containing protein [Haliscomenobacter hydrossis]|uniref:Peptidase S16 lon domain protein n=1 Tax=Haliscomenobacter hydrossis (strain ATCC 27775 / DSM 1100 / LMG 10767 / O) TaxID=760192 RepID=F4KUU0_HALH1|nr:LON peptidase substrate-binding domain-containing protein [Haliscomenobacter hydrossis]AEE48116.1 peptidase S16 lon domain protein [Haliscomenobacter hydrossis DSM 1100]
MEFVLLPQFPLQIVVYPNENLNLHIFEPRYRQLIKESEEKGTTFGIPTFLNNRVMPIGTEIQLLTVEKQHDGGEMDIKTKGISVYRMEQFINPVPGKLYAGATIVRIETDLEYDWALNEKILGYLIELFDLLNIDKPLPDGPSDFVTYDVAHHAGMSTEQEYELLTMLTEKERQTFLIQHLEQFLPMVKEMRNLQQRALLNGHFKDLKPLL